MKHIVLTGGGTAGHVTPNLALIPSLKEKGFQISYIGSYNGMEKELVEKAGIPYYGIATGKLRRYFDLKNLTDPFRVLKGVAESRSLMKKLQPDIVFSKGGFVAVPVVLAAHKKGIPVVLHESDMTPGLANKICIPRANKICCTFPETLESFPAEKAVLTGSPIRHELLEGDAARGRAFCGFGDDKPVLLVIGGSLGSVMINTHLRVLLPELLKDFYVVHLCGRGNIDPSLIQTAGYRQYEYIEEEMPDLYAMADLILSRAGANAICEIRALGKPNLLIPLSAAASRGDQILNARSFEKQGFSMVLEEDGLTREEMLHAIHSLYEDRERFIAAMQQDDQGDAVRAIVDLLAENC